MLSQKPPRVKCPPFNSAHRQAKTPRGLGAGQALQLSVEHNDPQILPELRDGLPQRCVPLAFTEDFFWCRSAIGDLQATVTLRTIRAIFMKRRSRVALAQKYQGFVDHYASKPGRERRKLQRNFYSGSS